MSGQVEGVDDTGRLLVVTSDGVTHGLSVGDVVHVRPED
jgi:biotin-(acetyl-CoA carboxylase) ligase